MLTYGELAAHVAFDVYIYVFRGRSGGVVRAHFVTLVLLPLFATG